MDAQTLQGMKKELTQAINRAATSSNKDGRLKAAEQANAVAERMYRRLVELENQLG